MVKVSYVRRAGGLLIARLDDGTTNTLFQDGVGETWINGGTAEPTTPTEPPPPDPTPTGDWVHPIPGATLTSGYGESRGSYLHVGVDLSTTTVAPGAPVVACTDMKITHAHEWGTGTLYDAGAYVKGHSVSGTAYSFIHMHLHPNTIEVSVGQTITAGTRIALEGTTGNSSGPHLHLEIWNGHMSGDWWYWGDGTPPDPKPILESKGVII